jgi:hypothetical protein
MLEKKQLQSTAGSTSLLVLVLQVVVDEQDAEAAALRDYLPVSFGETLTVGLLTCDHSDVIEHTSSNACVRVVVKTQLITATC